MLDLDPPPRIVIAGFGLLSPLGQSAWETLAALLAGRTLADRAAALPPDVVPVDLVRVTGGVSAAQHGADDPAVELAERAAREACFMAGVDPAGLPAFLGTSKGAVTVLSSPRARLRSAAHPPIVLGPHGYLTHRLRQRLGLGLVQHHVAACASSLTALHHARQWLTHRSPSHIAHRTSNMALAITSEAALTPVFIHSYRRLGVLAPLTPQGYRERPLDKDRSGFVLSEMGAAIVLRRLPPDVEPDIGEIELVDTAIACEAYDLIRPSPTMDALRHVAARLLPPDVDVIHPHAPGTADHDPAELRVYADVLAGRASPMPDLYASKGALGHSLGAAGLSSLVLACLCLTAGQRPPMPWLRAPLPWGGNEGASSPADGRPCSRAGRHAIFASGFAGHVAGALLRRH